MSDRKHIRTEDFPILAWQEYGKGMPIVLIHGFPENGDLWKLIIEELSAKFRLIIPDLPGAGDSKRPVEKALTVELMADSIREILDHLGVQSALFAGHSMGGYTALAFAEKYPDRIKGLSLVHSLANADDEEKKEARRKSIELIEKGGKEIFVRQMITSLFSNKFKESYPEKVQIQISRAQEMPDEDLIAFYKAIAARPDRTELLRKSPFPVQWIIGVEDKATPAEKALQQASLSDISFIHTYSACGHMSMLEQPTQLIADLSKFAAYCENR